MVMMKVMVRVRVSGAFMQVSVDVCVVVRTEGDWSILCLFLDLK